MLYGRGAADMKSSLAAMIVATEEFIAEHPEHKGTIGFAITSGEDGDQYMDGTPIIMDYLKTQGETLNYCLVGEPSSTDHCGDTIKIGRRGSLSGYLTIQGKQGHVAYPHLADNPVHNAFVALNELVNTEWDEANEHFPATSFQISNANAGTGAGNVIPGEFKLVFNFRHSPVSEQDTLKKRTHKILDDHELSYTLEWSKHGDPFISEQGPLIQATEKAIQPITGEKPKLSTSGGTSDGRFIAKHCKEIIELGPSNKTIHQINECVRVDDLEKLKSIYYEVLTNLLT